MRRYGSNDRGQQARGYGSPLEGRRLWEIGSWGNASDQIGKRWEAMGFEAASGQLAQAHDAPAGRVLVTLVEDSDLQSGLRSLGLTNSDALLVEPNGSKVRLRSVDFKWSLETASYRQISAEALTELLKHDRSPLPDYLARSGFVPMGSSVWTTDGGLFVVPDSGPNRQFVSSAANHHQEYPLEANDIVWVKVDGREFFGSLEWWWAAELLSRLDHSESSLDGLDGAERYYRLGAGLGGGLTKLNTPVFADESPPLDVHALVDSFLATHAAHSSEAAIEHLRPLITQRAARVQRLRALWQCPYSFTDLAIELSQQGIAIPPPDSGNRVERERWGAVHKRIAESHRAAINAAGLALLAGGQTEAAALAALDKRRAEFDVRARAFAQRIIGQELPGRSRTSR